MYPGKTFVSSAGGLRRYLSLVAIELAFLYLVLTLIVAVKGADWARHAVAAGAGVALMAALAVAGFALG